VASVFRGRIAFLKLLTFMVTTMCRRRLNDRHRDKPDGRHQESCCPFRRSTPCSRTALHRSSGVGQIARDASVTARKPTRGRSGASRRPTPAATFVRDGASGPPSCDRTGDSFRALRRACLPVIYQSPALSEEGASRTVTRWSNTTRTRGRAQNAVKSSRPCVEPGRIMPGGLARDDLSRMRTFIYRGHRRSRPPQLCRVQVIPLGRNLL
jgi:hypothetical protein